MKSIRIGNDIEFEWRIRRGSESEDFEGKDVKVVLRDQFGRACNVEWAVGDGGVIKGVVRGREQKATGAYTLTLVENDGKDGMATVDKVSAWRLVGTQDASVKDDGMGDTCGNVQVETVELQSEIGVGGQASVGVAVDMELDALSENAVANKAVTRGINEAKARAEESVTTANSAVTAANKAVTDVAGAKLEIADAVNTVNGVTEKADAAVSMANEARQTATGAETKASTAVSVANDAMGVANDAGTAATKALDAAVAATTTASGAVATANAAKDTAEAAQKKVVETAVTVGEAVDTANAAAKRAEEAAQKVDDGVAAGGGFYNVTTEQPLEDGYYTKATAIAALGNAQIKDSEKKGMIVTFEESGGVWKDYRFTGADTGAFLDAANWEEYGGAGTVKSVTVNGKRLEPDTEGNVTLAINDVTVDESLDADSTNPVQNAVVTAKLNEVEGNTVYGMTAELSEDESTVRLALTNKAQGEIAAVDIPAGSGSGGETSATRIVLSASVDKATVKDGDGATLTWSYDHQYSTGDEKGTSTGQKATVQIEMRRGATLMYSDTMSDVGKGTYTLDLKKYLQVGTTDIYVIATTTDPTTGKTQKTQKYVSVKVVSLGLASSFNIAESLGKGGYGASEAVSIPYAVSGSGEKTVTLYVDGVQRDSQVVRRSGTTNGTFNVSMSGLSRGRHTVQMVAELQADGLEIRSESIYLDLLKGGGSEPYIGTKMTFADGRIFESDHLTPTIATGQYEQVKFDFVAYDPSSTPATMVVLRDGVRTQTVSVPRSTQVYANRFTEQGAVAMAFKVGQTEYRFNVDVAESSIDIAETKAGLQMKLTAAGRSNSEANPGEWTSGDVETVFGGFDWSSNGWTGDALKLTNGAAIEIGCKPLAKDATSTGATYELELTCSNVSDREGAVVDCMADGVGFRLTAQEAMMRTGAGTEVSTKFASDMDLKIAFVVQQKQGTRLLELYVNGVRSQAKQYASTDSLRQDAPASITVTSDNADVELRNMRVYNRALTDDEELANYIIDRPTSDEMVVMFGNNAVMDDEGTAVDIDKLRAKGKGVMRIVGDIDLLNQTNNKKFEIPVDIYFYSPYGKEYDFVIYQCGLRIQGTSSTTYPRKNYRIYMSRSEKYGTRLYVNGVEVENFKYAFKPGARPIDIFCLKADFSDSSSTHNTGAVRIVNDVFKKCGWPTPPQEAYKGEYDVRIGVDGFPIDCFYDQDGGGTNAYLGKYNFNNEKSGSGIVYGFEGIEGFNDEATLNGERNKCICLEFLNNSEALCLFGTADMATFDDALEFRFKPDKTWATADEEDRAAVKRLWSWIQSCKGNPTKFLNEYKDYFLNDSPFAWYLITDYFMAVDNRAKNMMLVTWDGLHWMFIPYDMDTLFGVRNDSVLKYDYKITWETMDESIGSHAFAGHDSVLWELVRGCPEKLREVAEKLRSNMSLEYVLKVFNEEQMGNWCERIYNKDGDFKYIKPLTEGLMTADGSTVYYDYLYALQGSRYAHRTYTIQNRFALLDSQYVCGTYRKDSFAAYFGYKFGEDNRKIRVKASERYYFGYGYTSGTPHQSAVLAEDKGSEVELTLDTDLIVNDPQYVYGASRMMELDLTDVSHALLQTLNLSNCTALRKLDVSCAGTQSTLNSLIVGGCRHLRELNVEGLRSAGFTSLDLSRNTKLETLKAGNTSLTGVSLAEGAPLRSATLPESLQTLELRYLAKLTDDGLTLEGTDNVARLVVDNCPGVDWEALAARCKNVRYLRVTGLDMSGDGALLDKYMATGGVDEEGANVDTCRLAGTYRLTRYMDEEKMAAWAAHYPELNIVNAEYTCVMFDDTVEDSQNMTNMDNGTSGDAYEPSGHITLLEKRSHTYRCLYETRGGVPQMTCEQVSDADYAKMADGTPCDTSDKDGVGYDMMKHFAHYWYKGVNDFKAQKKYFFLSANKERPQSSAKRVTRAKLKDCLRQEYACVQAGRLNVGDELTIVTNTNHSCYELDVDGMKQVRWPGEQSAVVGAAFVDGDNRVLGTFTLNVTDDMFDFITGDYVFCDVPKGARRLVFSAPTGLDELECLAVDSAELEAVEPDWVEAGDWLLGVYGMTTDALGRPRSISGKTVCVGDNTSGTSTEWKYDAAGNVTNTQVPAGLHYTWKDIVNLCEMRGKGFGTISYEQSKDFANLAMVTVGDRDIRAQCGYGCPAQYTTGARGADGYGNTTRRGVSTGYLGNIILGVQNSVACCTEWMRDVAVNVESWAAYRKRRCVETNADTIDDVWHIYDDRTGEERTVQGVQGSGYCIGRVRFGRYADIIASKLTTDNSRFSTCYSAMQNYNRGGSRVVARANCYGNVSSGLAFVNVGYTSSLSNLSFGARLAFSGKIVIADGAEA